MPQLRRSLSLGLALAAFAAAAAQPLPNDDAFARSKPSARKPSPTAASVRELTRPGAPRQMEDRLGVPTFVWASKSASARGLSALRASPAAALNGRARADAAARAHLETFAPMYGLTRRDIQNARTVAVHDTGRGPVVVKLQQSREGIEIFREEASVLMDRDQNLIAISGYLASVDNTPAQSADSAFRLGIGEAVSRAFGDLTGVGLDSAGLMSAGTDQGGYALLEAAPWLGEGMPVGLRSPARVKQVWFHLPDALQAAYYVEVDAGAADERESDYYSYVISAADGSVLFRNNLTVDLTPEEIAAQTFGYRVWVDANNIPQDGPQGDAYTPHPTGLPDGSQAPMIAPTDVSIRNFPFSRNDPWLPAGSVETVGNNVDAYADLIAPDGYNPGFGDYRATALTGTQSFARTYDTTLQPNASRAQIEAATAHLFYLNNFLHDWFYDAGFDEASRNAQFDNFGRGGVAGDPIKAEAQDNSGRNNANMSTPADGNRPRMQMYVFDAAIPRLFEVVAPAAIAGSYGNGYPDMKTWPGQNTLHDLTAAEVVWVDDGTAATGGGTLRDGCEAPTATTWQGVAGKVALVDRGLCSFILKAKNAELAGATGVMIANVAANVTGTTTANTINIMSGDSATVVTIPAWHVSFNTGQAIRCKLSATVPGMTGCTAGAVTVNYRREPVGVDRDGTIDNQIVAHEWGHYLSNRLIGNANGLTNNMGRGMGEGWSDFVALLMTVRAEDTARPGNDQFQGVYSVAGYTQSGGADKGLNNGYYFGIRRVPQSTDATKNGLSFRHISAGTPPPNHPVAFWDTSLGGGGNNQVHNTGEVWSAMLWESYAALLRDTLGATPRLTFAQAQQRMKDYLVASLKLTPTQPTLLEARDAVLAAAYANDPDDYVAIWRAFAKRGAGVNAVGPDRYNTLNSPVTEDFTSGAELAVASATLTEDTVACAPGGVPTKDGILDAGDTALLAVTLKNVGEQAMTGVVGTVTSTNPHVTFPEGTTLTFPAVQPLSSTMATVRVGLSTAAGTTQQLVDLTVTWADPALPEYSGEVTLTTRANHDVASGQSLLDDAETAISNWSSTAVGSTPPTTAARGWLKYEETATQHYYSSGHSPNFVSDTALVSNNLAVGPNPFTIRFKHRFDFERDWVSATPRFFDGGVIELSTDGGATWVDVGALAAIGTTSYNGRITVTGYGNPLENRNGFVGQSTGYEAGTWHDVSLDLGTAYAGQTVKLRFRVATDGYRADWGQSGGGRGWQIDDIELGGIAGLPFPTIIPQRCGNRAPTVVAFASNSNRQERTTVTLAIFGSTNPLGPPVDADGDTVTYDWFQISGPAVTLSNANVQMPTFTAPDVGAAGATLRFGCAVGDGTQKTYWTAATVTVVNVNRAPVANAGAAASVNEGTLVVLDGSASADADGEALTYAWVQKAGPAVTLDGATGATARFAAPEVLRAGATLQFELTVKDPLNATSTATVDVTVNNVNAAPVASAGADVVADERTLVTLDGSASKDVDGDDITYAWQQTAGAAQVVLNSATVASPTFIAPEVGPTGELYSFTVTATDPDGLTSTDSVEVLVGHVNRAPLAITVPMVLAFERTSVDLDGNSSFDPDGDVLLYAWTQTGTAGGTLSMANGPIASFATGEVTQDTTYTFQLEVMDPATELATSQVSVYVINVNRAPVAASGASQQVAARSTATLDASASADEDGEALTYRWSQVSGPGVTLSDVTAVQPTFTVPDVRVDTDLTFVVTACDPSATCHTSLPTTVRALRFNRRPVANAGADFSAGERTTVTLDGRGSTDADGDTLTYLWAQTGGPEVVLSGLRTAQPTFTAPEVTTATELTFRLVVGDADGTSDDQPDNVVVTIQNVNRAPTAAAGGRQDVSAGATVTLDGTASTDVDGDSLSYSWTQVSGPIVQLSSTSVAKPEFTAPEVKSTTDLVFKLIVRDAAGASAEALAIVRVEAEGGGCSSTGGSALPVAALFAGLALLRIRRRRAVVTAK